MCASDSLAGGLRTRSLFLNLLDEASEVCLRLENCLQEGPAELCNGQLTFQQLAIMLTQLLCFFKLLVQLLNLRPCSRSRFGHRGLKLFVNFIHGSVPIEPVVGGIFLLLVATFFSLFTGLLLWILVYVWRQCLYVCE